MRKALALICAAVVSFLFAQDVDEGPVDVEDSDGLPNWTDDELGALESGEYIPGSSLMGKLAREVLDSETQEVIELDPAIQELPDEEPESEEGAKLIEENFLFVYFRRRPDGYLTDPQKILATQEFLDREGFLKYHARDTAIKFYLYLFDGPQELPETESLEGLVDSQFDKDKASAVVFYFMGDPDRSQLVYSNRVVDAVNLEECEKVLRLAIEDALEKSDPTSQLDSFSIQLSTGLARLEEIVINEGGSLSGGNSFLMPNETKPLLNEASLWEKLMLNQGLFYTLLGLAVALPAALLGLMGRWITNRRRAYVFPIAEGSTLLDAPHAAGVGGVLSFISPTAPPSSQEQDVPDYLQKM